MGSSSACIKHPALHCTPYDEQQGASAPGTGIGADVLRPPDGSPPGSCSLASLACRAAAKVLVPAPVCRPASAGGAAVPLLLLLGGAGGSAGLLTVLGRSDAAATLPASAWWQRRTGKVNLTEREGNVLVLFRKKRSVEGRGACVSYSSHPTPARPHVQQWAAYLQGGVFRSVQVLLAADRGSNAGTIQPTTGRPCCRLLRGVFLVICNAAPMQDHVSLMMGGRRR